MTPMTLSSGSQQLTRHRYGAMGFDMVNVGTDVTTLEFVMKQSMAAARGAAGPEKGKAYGS